MVAALCAAAAAADLADEETREAMREIFQSMRYLLPLSAGDSWQDAEQAGPVRDALQTVAERASLLAEHAQGDLELHYLGSTLAATLRKVLQRYERAEFEPARFLLLRATDYCIACHSRLPAHKDAPQAVDFVNGTALVNLTFEQRARLQMATRRFGDALASLETLFGASGVHPSQLPGALVDYLIISIRVRRDFDRALDTLHRFTQRSDLWIDLRADVRHWLDALREFRSTPLDPPTLALGIELIERATDGRRYTADRRSLVHYVLASSVLHRFVESQPQRDELAHAYYLLGLSEYRIGGNFWIPQGELFLEWAIRLAPASPVAADAYALLEEEILAGYTGSSGLHLPEDERQRLQGLRALIGAHPEQEL